MSSDNVRGSAPDDAGSADDEDLSIDSIIAWLHERRQQSPTAPLAELLGGKTLSRECLLDVACIDLIEQRRAGHQAPVEGFLRDFPQLRDDSARLDLIDAEICVDRELDNSPCLQELVRRFPDLGSQISDLLQMSARGDADRIPEPGGERSSCASQEIVDLSQQQSGSLVLGSALRSKFVDGRDSMDFSVAEASEHSDRALTDATHPIDVPGWFVGERCVASGPGHWLIRGRDATRGETLAMKIIELPVQITNDQVNHLMDACEKAAKVRNPCWLVPAVAAVQNRYLAVIRSWAFANPWQRSLAANPATRLQQLASVAYALQSAHTVGAAHGGIHPTNLLIDHQGKVLVVDCSATVTLVKRWFEIDEGFASWSRRQRLDVQDLVKLVVTDAVETTDTWTDGLVPRLRSIADQHPNEACGRIGDALMRWADEHECGVNPATPPSAARPGLRVRLARWISGDSR